MSTTPQERRKTGLDFDDFTESAGPFTGEDIDRMSAEEMGITVPELYEHRKRMRLAFFREMKLRAEPTARVTLRLPVSVIQAYMAAGPGHTTRMVTTIIAHADDVEPMK